MREILSRSIEETYNIGQDIASRLQGGEVIILDGDLGAGKTVFAKGLAKGLEIDCIINSPTFTIMNVYQGRLKFCHFDMYRIDDEDELRELGFDEYIGHKDNVCAIEWASKTPSLISDDVIKVSIQKIDQDSRMIRVEGLE